MAYSVSFLPRWPQLVFWKDPFCLIQSLIHSLIHSFIHLQILTDEFFCATLWWWSSYEQGKYSHLHSQVSFEYQASSCVFTSAHFQMSPNLTMSLRHSVWECISFVLVSLSSTRGLQHKVPGSMWTQNRDIKGNQDGKKWVSWVKIVFLLYFLCFRSVAQPGLELIGLLLPGLPIIIL